MTTYGALISLQNTIHHIILSSHFTLIGPSPEIIILAYKELNPLKEILEILDSTSLSRSRKKVNILDGRIKDTIWELEDLLESLVTDQVLSQSRSSGSGGERDVFLFSIDLQPLQDHVYSFIQTLKIMEKEYIYEVNNMCEDDDDESISLRAGFDGTKSTMIGLSDQFQHVKRSLMREFFGKDVYALVGMAGVGKTTLAKQIFEDPEIKRKFKCRVWVTVGRKGQLSQLSLRQLSRGILAQLSGSLSVVRAWALKQILKGKRCLIVMDDVWEAQVLDSWISSIPDIKNGFVQILVTARDRNVVANQAISNVVRFLNEEESKDLLCHKVFDDGICPPQLDKAVTKIANHCEGLPLMIVTVADLLSKSQNRDPEYWNDVAEKRNSVFTDAYNEITKVFFPSYDYLLQYLKMPFLYMGVFPPDYDFPPSKLINMLTAEGWFLNTDKKQSLEVLVWQCLHELCTSKNLVLFKEKSIFWHEKSSHGIYKTCRLHSTWRHVCREEARKKKFFQVLNKLVDGLEEGVKGQRCLCLENNILFGINEFCDSVRLNCASSTRSLLFFGPYHQYPIPLGVDFRLLRELDALKLRFYTFPTEILALVQLKYLSLTCNGELPTTISKLFNLRVLIVHPHMKIRCCGAPSYVPIQIWDMQELDHIEILGKSLVAPHHAAASLEKLSTLVGVNSSICTILELSKRIPNIRKLGVQIELTPYESHNDLLSCFGCISALGSLETLKCSIMNPVIKNDGYVVPAAPSSLMLPRGLKKLHLSGMGFPWEYMDAIGSLPFLQVLKLRCFAFRGSKWEAEEGSFLSLEFFLIEDTDLEYLNIRSDSFPELSYLSMKHCYKLKEIRWPLSVFRHTKIELVDCNPSALTCAKQLQLSRHILLQAGSSYLDEKSTTTKLQSYGLAEPEWSYANFFSAMFIYRPKRSGTSTTTCPRHFIIFSVIVLLGCLLKLTTATNYGLFYFSFFYFFLEKKFWILLRSMTLVDHVRYENRYRWI